MQGVVSIRDFRGGISSKPRAHEFDIMTNLVPQQDGSLEQRSGLNTLEVALTTGGGSPITPLANRNIFWHNNATIWIVCDSLGILYSANPTTGTVTQQLAGAAYAPWRQMTTDRLTSPLSLVGNGYYDDAGTKRYWSVNAAGTFAAAAVPGNAAYRTRGASRLLSFATYIPGSSAFLVGDGTSSATDTIGGVGEGILGGAAFGAGGLIGTTLGKILLLSGDFASRKYEEVGNLASEYFLPFTFRFTAIGTFFATTRSVYLFDGSLHDLTGEQSSSPNSLFEAINVSDAELATLEWDNVRKELWFSFEDSAGTWRTYIWNGKYKSWRKFEATLFDNGSFGLKQGFLYIGLKGYGSTVPGIYKMGVANKADPNGDIVSTLRPAWQYAMEGRGFNMHVHDVLVVGAGWDSTVRLHYTNLLNTDTYVDITLNGLRAKVPVGITCRRFKPEITATVTTSQATKAVNLTELAVSYSIEGVVV